MAELTVNKSASEFRKGFQAAISIAIGYAPVALTFGLLAKTTGLSIGETVLMSLVVYAGASQYMSLSLLTLGTGMIEIVLTTFIVNIRHFLMSTVINDKSEEDHLFNKAMYSFGITDETFSVASMKEGRLTTGFMFGLNLLSYMSWVICSGIGYVIGASLPQTLQESMSIALYAMFIGLLVPSMKKSIKIVFLAVVAGCFNTVFTITNALSTGWAIVVATLLSAIIIELIEGLKKKQRGNEHD
ncbi:4-azaleucine resistance transporter AzlC [Cytobacillus eiseniae]|uniref:4-azaleucine resistance transporter AzlC n=1 Tax=Cytobacillus eiseniae TaxID=762947 RepID=A0ABS4RDX4_9BACI|nr:AzlC family ABC transporter permease [Cytobacillus eiseniae]MBP2241105.1 4-azaleucine resistance transporter AzlC [Cytobacillus eiseniae]